MRFRLAMVSPFPEKPGIITGGLEGASHFLCEGLKQIADLEIHIVAPAYRRPAGLEKREGLTIHWLKMSMLPAFVANWSTFRRGIHRRLAEIKPDIAHFQGTATWLLGYRKPRLLTIHGIYEKDMLYKHGRFLAVRRSVIGATERLGRQRCPHTIIINPYILEEIGAQIRGRQWHIENPVAREFFELERAAKGGRVLFVGRISRLKNVHGLLRAFAKAQPQAPGATLHIAGACESIEYEKSCRRFAAQSGLSGSVEFLGNVSRADLLREFSEADCLALISYQDIAPMVVAEAMAAGVPVVASRVCGLPFMVEHGRTGYLVDPEATDEIAERLVRLMKDRDRNEAMGINCRQVAGERFHLRMVAQRTLALYRHILDPGSPR